MVPVRCRGSGLAGALPCGSCSARGRGSTTLRARWSSPRHLSVMELRWEGDETLRPGGGLPRLDSRCVLTLINRFDEIGKAVRDARRVGPRVLTCSRPHWGRVFLPTPASAGGRCTRRPPRAFGPSGLDDRPAGLELHASVEFVVLQHQQTRRSPENCAGTGVGEVLGSRWCVPVALVAAAAAVNRPAVFSLPRTASWSCSRPMMRTLERKLPSRPCCSTSPRPPPPPPRS